MTTTQILPYMRPQKAQTHVTEDYVSTPPALIVVDQLGAVWVLGTQLQRGWSAPKGEFAFDVLRNGRFMGEYASRIEMRGGRIRIFVAGGGFRQWTGSSFI